MASQNLQSTAAIETQEDILRWEARLEEMGPFRPLNEYREHLDQAPEAAPSKLLLRGFIHGLEVASIAPPPASFNS